jgi:hypothetical protein
MNLNAAVDHWKQTADWAQKVQDLASGTRIEPPLQHTNIVRLYR